MAALCEGMVAALERGWCQHWRGGGSSIRRGGVGLWRINTNFLRKINGRVFPSFCKIMELWRLRLNVHLEIEIRIT